MATTMVSYPKGGVLNVSIPSRKKLTGYEQTRLDVEEGRICSYDSLDDFIKEID